MKHTPGPWTLKGPCVGKWDQEGDYAILDSQNKIIAEVYKTVDFDDVRPAKANAILMIAAPELLEVCKRIAPIIKALEMFPFNRGAEPNSLADDLFKAIAKAEGPLPGFKDIIGLFVEGENVGS